MPWWCAILYTGFLRCLKHHPWHMFQPSCFEQEALITRGQLPSSCFFLKSIVFRLSWLECLIFMNFSSWSHFLQIWCNILTTNNNSRCVLFLANIFIISSRSLATKVPIFLALVKEVPGTSLRISTVYNF